MLHKMCTPFNDLGCGITMTTIGSPDATFVASQVGDDFQFRGIELGSGMIGVLSPTSMIIDTITPPNPIPGDGVIGLFDSFSYAAIAPLLQPTELPLTLLSTTYSTGIFVGSNLTVTTPSKYSIKFNPTYRLTFSEPNFQITFRIRSGPDVYAEFYSCFLGTDSITTPFDHVIDLPTGVYQFTVQATGLSTFGYISLSMLDSFISVINVG